MYLSLYGKGSKKVVWGFTVRGSWRLNITATFWPPILWPSRCVFLVLLILNRRPGGSSAGFLYRILSATFLDPNFGLMWLSLPHLVYNSVSNCNSKFLSWLSYIIVQHPLNHPLHPWNGMFDRHQAEITVMQFRGHSLPVYQSMSVSWDFLPCPISSAKHAHAISFDYWPLECDTFFRCITL